MDREKMRRRPIPGATQPPTPPEARRGPPKESPGVEVPVKPSRRASGPHSRKEEAAGAAPVIPNNCRLRFWQASSNQDMIHALLDPRDPAKVAAAIADLKQPAWCIYAEDEHGRARVIATNEAFQGLLQ